MSLFSHPVCCVVIEPDWAETTAFRTAPEKPRRDMSTAVKSAGVGSAELSTHSIN